MRESQHGLVNQCSRALHLFLVAPRAQSLGLTSVPQNMFRASLILEHGLGCSVLRKFEVS